MNTILIIILIIGLTVAVLKVNNLRNTVQDYTETIERSNIELHNCKSGLTKLTKENVELVEVLNMKNKTIQSYESNIQLRNEQLIDNIVFLTDNGKIAENVKVKTIVDENSNITIFPTIRRKVDSKWTEVPVNITIR